MRLLTVFTLLALAVTAAACSDSSNITLGGTYYGTSQVLGDGSARSFVTLADDGTPQSFGLRLTEDALNGLPAAVGEVVLPMPSQGPAPFNHIGLDWNPAGHEPPGVYDVPHFDIHFYLMTQAEQMNISLGDGGTLMYKAPAAAEMPAGYTGPPNANGVPMMGWHWIDMASPEFNGQPFTATLIYGFYNGDMNFVEPMITRAYLQTKPNFSKTFGRPAQYPKSGYYPGGYSISFDTTTNEYVISMTSLQHS